MVKFQYNAALKRLSFASLIVFLLSIGNLVAQHDAHDSEQHGDEQGVSQSDDHHEVDAEAGHHTDEPVTGHNDSHAESHEDETFNAGEMIMHHIQDDHIWHFWDNGVVYLPVILYSQEGGLEVFSSVNFYDHHQPTAVHNGYSLHHGDVQHADGRAVYDFSITKNVASLLISVVFMLVVFLSVGRFYKDGALKAPKGLASFFEPIVVFVRDEIAKPNIGPKHGKYMPYLLTLFFFIWLNNLFGLTPGAANLSGNIAVTMVLAVCTFLVVNFSGNKNYWKHIFATPGVPKPVLLILVPVEFIGIFTKPFSLMIRLFVSITAGHIVVLSLIGLIFIFQSFIVGAASMVLVTFINMIELLVATIQAYVFTMFTALYIGQAVEEHHDH